MDSGWVPRWLGGRRVSAGAVAVAAEEGRVVEAVGVVERGRWGEWAGRVRRWAAGGELGWAQKFGDFVVGWSFAGWAAAIEWQRKRGEVWRGAVAVWRDVAVVGEPLGWMWETWWEGAGAW